MARVETKIQDDIIKYLRGLGAHVENVGGGASTAKGSPDLRVCYRGRYVAFEVKRPDEDYEEPRKVQSIRIKQIRKAGGVAEVVTTIADVKRVLREEGLV